jgi:hypothetical protein
MKFASVSNARIDDSGSSDGGVKRYSLSSLLCCEWLHSTFGRPTTVLFRVFFFDLVGFDRSPLDGGVLDAADMSWSSKMGECPLLDDPPSPSTTLLVRPRFRAATLVGGRFVPREAAMARPAMDLRRRKKSCDRELLTSVPKEGGLVAFFSGNHPSD